VETEDPVREISRTLSENGSAVQEVRVERPDLEAVFLKLTGRSLRD
jgi:ABC-type multidrug transport system ATPase subunit